MTEISLVIIVGYRFIFLYFITTFSFFSSLYSTHKFYSRELNLKKLSKVLGEFFNQLKIISIILFYITNTTFQIFFN